MAMVRGVSARARDDRRAAGGQALVEFAMAVPVFFALLFGCLEGGLLFKTHAAYQEAAQEAVRMAAAAGQSSDADAQALTELQTMLSTENLNNISAVTIYDATSTGAFAVTPTTTDTAHTNYIYSASLKSFLCKSTNAAPPCATTSLPLWNPATRNISVSALDHIGIQITYSYRGATKLLPALTLTQTSTSTIEPNSF